MTHEERLALIYKPFIRITYHTNSYLWAGTLISRPTVEEILTGKDKRVSLSETFGTQDIEDWEGMVD